MLSNYLLDKSSPAPICVGSGLLVLDVVINGDPQRSSKAWAGGSCGNVLTILSYLGWNAYPIARLGNDEPARILIDDLLEWQVKTDLISQDKTDKTPVVIERIKVGVRGAVKHSFELTCPKCRMRLPRFRAVSASTVRNLVNNIPQSKVFYFDRVRRSLIELATQSKRCGALVFFEPSSIRNRKLFLECLQIADVVKYSNERMQQVGDIINEVDIPLEIETLGNHGLRYRMGKNNGGKRRNSRRHTLPAFTVNNLVDAAGSGDWCSAGILHLLGRNGNQGFQSSTVNEIETALQFGQALATLNCYYEGARGSMYNLAREKLVSIVNDILKGTSSNNSFQPEESNKIKKNITLYCPNCSKEGLNSI